MKRSLIFKNSGDKIAELHITEYPVGAVINRHRYTPPFELIPGLSLAGDCQVRLRPNEKEK